MLLVRAGQREPETPEFPLDKEGGWLLESEADRVRKSIFSHPIAPVGKLVAWCRILVVHAHYPSQAMALLWLKKPHAGLAAHMHRESDPVAPHERNPST
jgi:hypothetical protein